MWTKVLLAFAVVFLLSQNISAESEGEKKGAREYVVIENATYYVDVAHLYYREEAKTLCESLDMTLVTFETEEKWNAEKSWLLNSGYGGWWWTGALRDVGSTLWYWEHTGAEIVNFHWAAGQPDLDDNSVQSGIGFTTRGWEDDYGNAYLFYAMCQEKIN